MTSLDPAEELVLSSPNSCSPSADDDQASPTKVVCVNRLLVIIIVLN